MKTLIKISSDRDLDRSKTYLPVTQNFPPRGDISIVIPLTQKKKKHNESRTDMFDGFGLCRTIRLSNRNGYKLKINMIKEHNSHYFRFD